MNLALTRSKLWEFHWVSCNFKILTHLAHPGHTPVHTSGGQYFQKLIDSVLKRWITWLGPFSKVTESRLSAPCISLLIMNAKCRLKKNHRGLGTVHLLSITLLNGPNIVLLCQYPSFKHYATIILWHGPTASAHPCAQPVNTPMRTYPYTPSNTRAHLLTPSHTCPQPYTPAYTAHTPH